MTVDEAIADLSSFTFTGGLALWRVQLAGRKTDRGISLVVKLVVPDRRLPDVVAELGFIEEFSSAVLRHLSKLQWRRIVVQLIRHAVKHETDESIVCDGGRLDDPHRDTKKGIV